MRNRTLETGARGWGRSVHAIQHMPPPAVRHADETMTAIVPAPRESAA
jgi:dihydroorotase